MRNQRVSDPARIGIIMGAIALSLMAAILYIAATGGSESAQASPGAISLPKHAKCFPASQWDGSETAPDSVRPCVQIRRVYEDGSFVAAVMDANGVTRYTVGIGARDR
jgi:hypothetical protein